MSLGSKGLSVTGDSVRAWGRFDGANANPFSTLVGENVSGITDNGPGDYTIVFQSAMPTSQFALLGTAQFPTTETLDLVEKRGTFASRTAASVRLMTVNTSTGAGFDGNVNFAVVA